ncbi:MAG: Origin recognition complex, subunit 1 [Piccolia ochrophora]|nr:MAG: Origin recognition complex, subunit 1 [Piccolia ochrophora]
MARLSSSRDASSSKTKVGRARQYLKHGGVSREDSDDELGLEDLPWEWIYDQDPLEDQKDDEASEGGDASSDESAAGGPGQRARKRRSTAKSVSTQPIIVGARMGKFSCKVGDAVLLKAEGTNQAWVGLICGFQEDEEEEDDKCANFMWFSSEKEIRNKQKKRQDFMQNELYISPSWDINPLASINGRATILSTEAFYAEYPSGKIPKTSPESGKTFVCRRGCNTRTATYTEEFVWEEVYPGRAEDLYGLIERIKTETKATRKRRRDAGKETYEADQDEENDGAVPETPRKKRKTTPAVTPKSHHSARSRGMTLTPIRKKIIIKRPLEFTPLGTRVLSPNHLTSPFQVARSKLHVAAVPATLPCRETEFSAVYSNLEAAIADGSGSCIYISGTPGTGKTATVREVVSQLHAAVAAEELDDFIFVEINGMKVTDPHQSYSLLWEALRGERVSPSHALDLLEREFAHPSPRRVPCVVLMDELDQLVTKNQSVMYNFFNWPGLRHSRLIVLAVANTMDLPERTLSNKISSRLGLTRITFPGYSHDQLMRIIHSRLDGVPGGLVDPDAVQFASRKVAAVSGDARRALDICRRAVELAETEAADAEASSLPPTPSKTGRAPSSTTNAPVTAGPTKPRGKVTIATVKQAIHEATTTPLQQYLRSLPLASKLFLAAVLARMRRTGVAESVLGDVLAEAARIGHSAGSDNPGVGAFLVSDALRTEARSLAATGRKKRGRGAPRKDHHPGKVARVLGMGAAAVELMEAGVIGLEARKGERTGRVRLIVGEEEVKGALGGDGEGRGLGFGG